MKVKLHQRMAGPAGNFAAGEVVDLDNETAKSLLNSNQASPVKDEPKAEKAVVTAEETAAKALKKAGIKTEKAQKQAKKESENPEKQAEKTDETAPETAGAPLESGENKGL